MSAITINGDLLHYEVLGRGRPVILLHSWLGSWRYWIPTMQQLSMKYRTYAVDLWGFGDSGKNKFYYGIEGQVELLEKFIERMGIPKAVFIGHGLGAVVATQFSVKPGCTDVVHRMMAIGMPLFDTPRRPRIDEKSDTPATDAPTIVKVSPEERERLRAALAKGYTSTPTPPSTAMSGSVPKPVAPPPLTTPASPSPAAASTATAPTPPPASTPVSSSAPPTAASAMPTTPTPATTSTPSAATPKTTSSTNIAVNPLMVHVGKNKPGIVLSRHMDTSSADYEKMKGEVEKADEEAFLTSIQSLSEHNPFHNLQDTKAPTLAVYGVADTFIQMPDKALLQKLEGRDEFRVITLPDIRHFPMLEDTTTFTRLLREFLDAPTIADIEIKEEWRRRTR